MQVLSRNKAVDIGQPNITMFDHYCGDILGDYESGHLFGPDSPPFVLTKLSPSVKNMGNGLGLDIFGNDFEGFLRELRSKFSPDTRARLQSLKEKFDVERIIIQTTEDAVAGSGISKEKYIQDSRNYICPPSFSHSEPKPELIAA